MRVPMLTMQTHGTVYEVPLDMCKLAAAGGELKSIAERVKPLADALVAAIAFTEAAPLVNGAMPESCLSACEVVRDQLVALDRVHREVAASLDRYQARLSDAATNLAAAREQRES